MKKESAVSKNYRQRILDKFGPILNEPGAIVWPNDEIDFWSLLDEVSFSATRLVEIGTARGISATLLSEVAQEIVTFDVISYPIRFELWKHFDIYNRISSYIVSNTLGIKLMLESMSFDAAFIDGNHTYDFITKDILIVKKCGKILFHDYDWPDVEKAIKELVACDGGQVTVKNKFAVWQK